MVDHKLYAYRSRDPISRQERRQTSRRGTGDLLAELARLIGQGANGARYNTHSPAPSAAGGSSRLNWAVENAYPEQRQQGEVAPRRAHPSESYVVVSQERSDEKEPPPGRYFSGPAVKFNSFHEDGEHPSAVDNVQCRDDRQPVSPGGENRPPVFPSHQVPTFLLRATDGRHDADTQRAETGEVYGADDYYVDIPDSRRRDGLVIVVAVLALAVLGTAGTFAYRAIFGGSALPTASAIVKTANWPNKIVSNYGDDQRSDFEPNAHSERRPERRTGLTRGEAARHPGAINNGTALHFHNSDFSKLERSFARHPRICGGCPIRASACACCCPSGAYGRICPAGGTSRGPGFRSRRRSTPSRSAQTGRTSVGDAPAMPTATSISPLAPAPVPAPGSSEPKKIHTVTIRSDGSGRPNTSVAAHNTTSARRPSAAAAPPVGNQPMSPTPDARDNVRTRMTVGRGTAAEASSRRGLCGSGGL